MEVMRKRLLVIALVFGMATLFVAAGIYAGTDVPEEIKMENAAYSKHSKGVVTFTHKKHTDEYAKQFADFYKNGCGECHHDKDNKPLSSLKAGDEVQSCMACHKKPGERPKGKNAPKLTKSQKLEYHAEAIHMNCKGCHKKVNKKTKKKSAPTTCAKCHPKTKK
ncbi:cytochrome c3 family protein [Thermodesulfobacteriota bacterium]